MSKARELAELSRTVSDSADAVAITIDSSENVTFANDILVSGNVGIGTAPSRTFHSKGASGISTAGKFEAGGSQVYVQLSSTGQADGDSGYIGYDSSKNLTLFTDNTERLRITGAGALQLSDVNSPNDINTAIYSNSDVLEFEAFGTNGAIAFSTGSSVTERLLISSAGDVEVKGGQELRVYRGDNATYGSIKYLTGSGGLQLNDKNGDGISFVQNDGASEYGRFDASGNFGIGSATYEGSTTSNASSVWISSAGYLSANVNNDWGLGVNRTGTDGTLVNFRKNGANVGSIGVDFGDRLYIGTGNTALFFNDASDAIQPFKTTPGLRDNAIDLGTNGYRFRDAYIVEGVTNGSDGNDKQDIETLSDAEQRVAVACKGLLRKWRWKDAVEAKGDEARIHFGIVAQDLQAAFEAEGLDAGRYAMFMSNTWTDEETGEERTRLGVRYSELLAFIISAI